MGYFIQKAIKKKGSLSHQLGIPVKKSIPVPLLRYINSSPVGSHLNVHGKSVPVTRLLKRRSNLALTLKRLRRR